MIQVKVPHADKVMRNWPNSHADWDAYWCTPYCSGLELEAAQDVCAAADVCGGSGGGGSRSVGEKLDNHNPDQSSRQLVRWEMTAGGVQPLVIDEKGTE